MKIAPEIARQTVGTSGNAPPGSPIDPATPELPFAMLVAAYSASPGTVQDHEAASPGMYSAGTHSLGILSSEAGGLPGHEEARGAASAIAALPADPIRPAVAAIRPAIGESAHAFSASALLVGTAFQQRATPAPAQPARAGQAISAQTHETPPLSGPTTPIIAMAGTDRFAAAGNPAQFSPSAHGLPVAPAVMPKEPTPAMKPAHPAIPGPAQSPERERGQPDFHAMAAQNTSGAPTRSRASAAHGAWPMPSTAASPYLAQFVPMDGALRLVLRLPRLPDGMQAELEARSRQLLNAFGYHRHELLIRQGGRG